MPRRKTQEEFEANLREINKDIVVTGTYVNNSTPISCKCSICGHEWRAQPRSLLRGSGCRPCFYANRRISERDFINMLEVERPNIKLVGGYTMASGKATFVCERCGTTWNAVANTVLHTTGCPNCSKEMRGMLKRKSSEQFRDEMAAAHPDIDLLSDYETCNTPVLLRCQKCGHEWSQLPKSALSGPGCHICHNSRRRTNEQFVEELNEINPEVEPLEKYNTSMTKMTFRCRLCGHQWITTPSSVLSGTGCEACCKTQSSFFEIALLETLRQSLGSSEVMSRTKSQIGSELDIYIPSLELAFEPGAWYYHKKQLTNDEGKHCFCQTAGIKLITIYFGFPKDEEAPYWATTTQSMLGIGDWKFVVSYIKDILDSEGISYDTVSWDDVKTAAIRASRRRTTDRFSAELAEINPNIKVLGEYVGRHEKILVKCSVCGHEWSARAGNLLNGRGCPACKATANGNNKRKGHEQFVAEARDKCPSVKVVGQYKNSSTKILVRCRECGREWEAFPYNILSGRACISCSRKKSHDEFVNKLHTISPDIDVLSTYRDDKTPIHVACHKCGHEWEATPHSLIGGSGCQVCAWVENGLKSRMSDTEFRNRLTEANPTVVALEEYVTSHTKIKVRCLECGHEWNATPANLLHGRACSKCGARKRAAAKVLAGRKKFASVMSALHGDIEILSEYTGHNAKVDVKCKTCGHTWSALPRTLVNGNGCPKCKDTEATRI